MEILNVDPESFPIAKKREKFKLIVYSVKMTKLFSKEKILFFSLIS